MNSSHPGVLPASKPKNDPSSNDPYPQLSLLAPGCDFLMAFDTETTLIADRSEIKGMPGVGSEGKQKRTGNVLTSPWVPPDLILGSTSTIVAGKVLSMVRTAEEMADVVTWAMAEQGVHLVGHNIGFDIDVLVKFRPSLAAPFTAMAEAGRLHDTKILDQLYGLAGGRYDRPTYHPDTKKWYAQDLVPRSLDTLAKHYLGILLPKDPRIRLGFGAFRGRPLSEVPEEFLSYAKQDATVTLRVFLALLQGLVDIKAKNLLSEATQIRADMVVRDMDRRGICVDQEAAQALQKKYLDIRAPLEDVLVEAGLGRWEPVKGTKEMCDWAPAQISHEPGWTKIQDYIYEAHAIGGKKRLRWVIRRARPSFHLCTAPIQANLTAAGLVWGKDTPRRADGSISLEYDYWASRVLPQHAALRTWLDYTKVSKILTTYLNVYSKTPRVFPKWWVLGARSGRMSASCPSVQNIPKRKLGIRALFVSDPGKVFVRADYSGQEMFTLCEAMHNLGIQGPLYDILVSGKDPHRYAASLMLRKSMDLVTKEERQGTKALNFGVPGGLGAASLAEYAYATYGVQWSEKEAAAQRTMYLNVFDDIAAYLKSLKRGQDYLLREKTGASLKQWAQSLNTDRWNIIKAMLDSQVPDIVEKGIACERYLSIELPTGFRRSQCRFTEGANCHFQGLAAAVTKEAMFRTFLAHLDIVLVVHDEIVVQCLPKNVDYSSKVLEQVMLEAFAVVCPTVGRYAKVEVTTNLTRWGPATDFLGKNIDIGSAVVV